MRVFRAMCSEEANQMTSSGRLSFRNRFKWFGTEEFVRERVQDGRFNRSNLVTERYSRLFEFEVADDSLIHFNKCGYRELMLDRRKYPLVRISIIGEVI